MPLTARCMTGGPIPIRARRPIPRRICRTGRGLAGIRIGKPPVFPVRAVAAMRCVLAADEQGQLIPFARALFEAYWGDLKDISQPRCWPRRRADRRSGSARPCAARSQAPEIKEALRANTDALIARGGFGSPTLFVNGEDMYFGNDRLPLVEAALLRAERSLTGRIEQTMTFFQEPRGPASALPAGALAGPLSDRPAGQLLCRLSAGAGRAAGRDSLPLRLHPGGLFGRRGQWWHAAGKPDRPGAALRHLYLPAWQPQPSGD